MWQSFSNLCCLALCFWVAPSMAQAPTLTPASLLSGVTGGGSSSGLSDPYYAVNMFNCSTEVWLVMRTPNPIKAARLTIALDRGTGSYSYNTTDGLQITGNTIVFDESVVIPSTTSNGTVTGNGFTVSYSTPNMSAKTLIFKIPIANFPLLERGQTFLYTGRYATAMEHSYYPTSPRYFGTMLCPPTVSIQPNADNFTVGSVATATQSIYPHPLTDFRVHIATSSNNWTKEAGFASPLISQSYTASGTSTQPLPAGLVAGQTYYISVRWWNGVTLGEFSQPVPFVLPVVCNLQTSLSTANESCSNSDGRILAVPSGGAAPYSYAWSNGATTSELTGLSAGSYSLTVTDAAGCTSINSANLINDMGLLPSAAFSYNDNDPLFDFIDASQNAVSWTWNFGDGATDNSQNPSHYYAANGFYTVVLEVTNSCGQTSVYQAIVEVKSYSTTPNCTLSATASASDETALGAADGNASVNYSNEQGSVYFNWNTGANTAAISGLNAGNYTVTVSDDAGCSVVVLNITVGAASGGGGNGVNYCPIEIYSSAQLHSISEAVWANNSIFFVSNENRQTNFPGYPDPNTGFYEKYLIEENAGVRANLQTNPAGDYPTGIVADASQIRIVHRNPTGSGYGFQAVWNAYDLASQTHSIQNQTIFANANWLVSIALVVNPLNNLFVAGFSAAGYAEYSHVQQPNGTWLHNQVTAFGQQHWRNKSCSLGNTAYVATTFSTGGQVDLKVFEMDMTNGALLTSYVVDADIEDVAKIKFINGVLQILYQKNGDLWLASQTGTGWFNQSLGLLNAGESVNDRADFDYRNGNLLVAFQTQTEIRSAEWLNNSTWQPLFSTGVATDQSIPSLLLDANNDHYLVYSANDKVFKVNLSGCATTACAYALGVITAPCSQNAWLPVIATQAVPIGVRGITFSVAFDPSLVMPTGVVELLDVVTNGDPNANYFIYTDVAAGLFHVTIFYNSVAASNAMLTGAGDLCKIEFAPLSIQQPALFSIAEFQEGYDTHTLFQCGTDGQITFEQDSNLLLRLLYWDDVNRPLPNNNTTYLYEADSACAILNSSPFQPNGIGMGNVTMTLANNGSHAQIVRDIPNGALLPIVGGSDAHFALRFSVGDPSFIPTIFQAIASDVNLDGYCNGADISLIQSRSVGLLGQFPHGKDWLFVNPHEIATNPAFSISGSFPADDLTGYSRLRIPQLSDCLPITSTTFANGCTNYQDQDLYGILLGDVDSSWGIANGAMFRQTASTDITIDLQQARMTNNCEWTVPILVHDTLTSLDLRTQDGEQVYWTDLRLQSSQLAAQSHRIADEVFFSSYAKSVSGMVENDAVLELVIQSPTLSAETLQGLSVYLNGQEVRPTIIESNQTCSENWSDLTSSATPQGWRIYPNPASHQVWVEHSEPFTEIRLYNSLGQLVKTTNESLINLEHLPTGVYLVEIRLNTGVSQTKKLEIMR